MLQGWVLGCGEADEGEAGVQGGDVRRRSHQVAARAGVSVACAASARRGDPVLRGDKLEVILLNLFLLGLFLRLIFSLSPQSGFSTATGNE